jgi:hypothetical protein
VAIFKKFANCKNNFCGYNFLYFTLFMFFFLLLCFLFCLVVGLIGGWVVWAGVVTKGSGEEKDKKKEMDEAPERLGRWLEGKGTELPSS